MNDYNDDPRVSYATDAPHIRNLEVTFYASNLISIMLKGACHGDNGVVINKSM